jgi:hypothetical protein
MGKTLLLITLFILGSGPIKAQTSLGVGDGRQILGIQDTICDGSIDVYSIWVKNEGAQPLSGTIYMNMAVDSGLGLSWNPMPDSMMVSGFAPGDSVQMFHTQQYDTADQFRVGGNIVVIWPSSQGCITVDSSLHTPVYVSLCNSVVEVRDDLLLGVYPNPSSGQVEVHTHNPSLNVALLQVLDTKGKLLEELHSRSSVSLEHYPDGVYFLRAEFTDGTVRTYKIIRRD